MLFKSALISALLLGSVAFANDRHGRRRFPFFSSIKQRANFAPRATKTPNDTVNGTAAVQFAANNTIQSASATFKLPSLTSNGRVAAYIGLDVDPFCNNLLLAWIEFTDAEGSLSYQGFTSFLTDTNKTALSDVSFAAGDDVKMTVAVDTPKKATIIVEKNGHSYHHSMTTDTALCQASVSYLLLATPTSEKDSTFYPLPKFGTFTFKDVEIITPNGVQVIDNGPDTTIDDMSINGTTVVVKTSLNNGTIEFTQQH